MVAHLFVRVSRLAFLFLCVGVFCVIASGVVGTDYGIKNLFLDDAGVGPDAQTLFNSYLRNRPSFLTQICIALLISFAWMAAAFVDRQDSADGFRDRFRSVLAEALLLASIQLVVAGATIASQALVNADDGIRNIQIAGGILGFATGMVMSWLLMFVAITIGVLSSQRTLVAMLLIFTAFTASTIGYPKLIPAVSLFLVFLTGCTVYVAVKLVPQVFRLPINLLIGGMIWLSFAVSEPLKFPGLESYYAADVASPQAQHDACKTPASKAIDLIASLEAWRDAQAGSGEGRRPKLVLVAASGGAYRASFWSGLVMDKLSSESLPQGRMPGFDRSIRFLTGASGGMVALAYYSVLRSQTERNAVSIVERLSADIVSAQRKRSSEYQTDFPVARDSLSGIAQHVIQRDIPELFIPFMKPSDRGAVLEESWATLQEDFGGIEAGEREGWRPSLIFSPVMTERGVPLLISNLELSDIVCRSEGMEELFVLFPEAQAGFQVGTAVRMSATFPYISPILELPTADRTGIVDAGYFDNYGMSTAIGLLNQPEVKDWVVANTEGVLIVQIRAFPADAARQSPEETSSNCKYSAGAKPQTGALSWLTGPIEAALTEREAGMKKRNDEAFELLQKSYPHHGTDQPFMQTIWFENSAKASMTWNLPEAEMECLESELDSVQNKVAFERIAKWWSARK